MSFHTFIAKALFITIAVIPTSYAALYYRHVPFTLALSHTDTVIVDYDLSDASGLRCTSNQKAFALGYNHKGYFKSAHLPVSLVSNRIPEKKQEKLADQAGQFTINLEKPGADDQRFQVQCDYLTAYA